MEAIANFLYERQVRLKQCQNCTSYPLFPEYPAGSSAAARGFLSPTLANPGDNTPAGRFGTPSRREQSLTLSLHKKAERGDYFSWDAQARYARARGNYEGVMIQTNGSGEEKYASLFDFPLSHLTRSQYAEGPLDPDEPSSMRLHATWSDPGSHGITAQLGWAWRQGSLRTPHLRSPFSSYAGLIPGSDPEYYRFAQAVRGYTDLLVLRDFTPAQRGTLGRNPAATGWELALGYRIAAAHGALNLRLEIQNLFNQTHALTYEDSLEPEPGYLDAISSGPAGESLGAAGVVTSRGVVNPVYGLPATVQLPRQVRFGFEWSF